MTTTTARQPGENVPWYARSGQDVVAQLGVDADDGLTAAEAERRLGEYGRNELPTEVEEVESTELVPGDIVLLEAGDVFPADGRILSSATLEVQEAALTGESAPVPKDAGTLPEGEVALGDRTNLVFQNTQVTRGTTTFVVTAWVVTSTGGSPPISGCS
jgi:magnesium-transporting ATPase (P-type)